jgi:Domain of unknown function (DUF4136)
MMKPSRILVAVASVVAATVLTTSDVRARDVKVRIDHSKTFDFAAPKTWSWYPERPGDVLMARTADDDSEVVKKRAEPIIFEAVAAELARKGLKQVPSGGDLIVKYYVLITIGSSAQYIGQFVPSVPEWGLPPMAGATQALRVIEQGSFVVDIRSKDDIVWRGVAVAELKPDQPQEKRAALLKEATRRLFDRFPPKK